jgi:Skp family chaperone for outer membrane proteins
MMDRKTLALILTEVVLIVALVVVVAMDFNLAPEAEKVAATAEEAVAEEGAAEEAAEETVVAKAEEAEEAEAAEEAEEAEEAEAPEEVAEKEAPAEEVVAEKAAAPAKAAAGSGAVADVIPLENPAYAKHTKGIVQFTHKKHYTEYKAACGDCHHDENAEPLTDLKEGDPVQGCIECHPKASKAPRKKGVELSQSEKMEYHAEALHANCITCHKEYNKKNNTKAAPTSCGKCHPKTKK